MTKADLPLVVLAAPATLCPRGEDSTQVSAAGVETSAGRGGTPPTPCDLGAKESILLPGRPRLLVNVYISYHAPVCVPHQCPRSSRIG